MVEGQSRKFPTVTDTYMSAQPCSPIMSMALRCSPADRYISAAARGSLLLLAQSACLVIRIRELLGSVAPTKSCEKDTHTQSFHTVANFKFFSQNPNANLSGELEKSGSDRTMWVKAETGGREPHKQQAARGPYPPVSILPKTNSL